MVAKHDGTECFNVTIEGPKGCSNDICEVVSYIPVPGGVIAIFTGSSAVFIPMARLEYELAGFEASEISNVHLTSTMAQLLQAGAMIGATIGQQFADPDEGSG